MDYINSLVNEKACIGVQTLKTLEDEEKFIADAIKSLNEKTTVKIVVEINNKFMGSAEVKKSSVDATKHVCSIGIGLHSDVRGKGVGTELLKTLMQQGRDVLECSVMKISVYEQNTVAKGLYEKMGFKETGRIPNGANYYGKIYDEIIMVREL